MDTLLLCRGCSHPAPGHDGSGCSRCSCMLTLQSVIELALENARDEMRRVWADGPSTA
jgi:hypothetical protein